MELKALAARVGAKRPGAGDVPRHQRARGCVGTGVRLRSMVDKNLGKNYSAEQIAGRLRREFSDEAEMWVCAQTRRCSMVAGNSLLLLRESIARLRYVHSMMETRTGRAALTVLLTLSAFTLVGCSAEAADEFTPSAAPSVIATVEPSTAEVPTPTAQASIPELADVAPAPVVFDASTDVDAVEFPESMTGDELAHARESVQTNVITAQCMKEKGYDYTFRPSWAWSAEPSWIAKLPADQRAAAGVALDGPGQTPGDYRWEDGGCWGYAVHVMGNDDAH